ncbi:MAG: hypothetical protein ABL859_03595 [Methylotenera sp.]|uniref:hypothetical protein n=1 Tax=Methylotenera sp. TaxID=2051956 RepID=UPI00180F734F|nr:hypothetical protein [Methylotenera sp.]NOU25041.1 hypothetical protein [Methylotenera sp.]
MNEKLLQLLRNDVSLYPTKLELEYPHIFNKILEIWETDQANEYFNLVVFDSRGDRLGFPDEVSNELWKLHLHRLKINSEFKDPAKKDYWDWVS